MAANYHRLERLVRALQEVKLTQIRDRLVRALQKVKLSPIRDRLVRALQEVKLTQISHSIAGIKIYTD